jgi:hypothetical protein
MSGGLNKLFERRNKLLEGRNKLFEAQIKCRTSLKSYLRRAKNTGRVEKVICAGEITFFAAHLPLEDWNVISFTVIVSARRF